MRADDDRATDRSRGADADVGPDPRATAEQTAVLLARLEGGDAEASGALFDLLYDDLRALAGSLLRGQSPQQTLHPTALVHEAYLRLVGGNPSRWTDQVHFVRLAARAMRSVVVDHARARAAAKRGGGWTAQPLDAVLDGYEQGLADMPRLDEALERLGAVDEELVRVVELRFFAGMSHDEVEAVLGVSRPTVERRWRAARAWLRRALQAAD